MRIWDLPPASLCRQHLLGEHRELHAVWSVLTTDKKGYANHPETRRWQGKLAALYLRHEQLAEELQRRGYRHNSPLDPSLATGCSDQNDYVNFPEEQAALLRAKQCDCTV